MSVNTSPAIGYAGLPAICAIFAANAPWLVTVITGILGSTWYAVQLYDRFMKAEAKIAADKVIAEAVIVAKALEKKD